MRLTPPPPTTPSFAKSAIPLLLTLKPSRIYITWALLLHLLAVPAITIASIPIAIKLLISVAVVISLGINMRDALEHKQIVWRAGNHWFIETTDNQQQTAKLSAINFLSRWLVIISLKQENRRAAKYIIPFDAISKDSFRLFRVRLRIEGHELLNPTEIDR